MEDQDLLRYSRHILLNEFGIEGQERIISGRVLIIGAGGLGSPAAIYLASAGVGCLTICDDDKVDMTNLQRQILHRETRLGVNKAASAQIELADINPNCDVRAIEKRVGPNELADLVADTDVVIEASDNFETRYAVNQACVDARKPLVSGSAIRFVGQIAVFDTRRATSPCYACFLQKDTPTEEERCVTMGVLAPLTGTIGSMQATEALHLLVSNESELTGRVLLYDSLSAEWQSVPVPRDPNCAVCGSRDEGMSDTGAIEVGNAETN